MAVAIIVLIIISSFIIFILIYRKQGIVKDSGINKIIFFSIGIGIYFLSNVFIGYSSYMECSLYFTMKHIGIILFLIIFYIYIALGYELGTVNINNEKYRMVSSFSLDSLSSISSDASTDLIRAESTSTVRQENRLYRKNISRSMDDKLNSNENNNSEKRKFCFQITKLKFIEKLFGSSQSIENNISLLKGNENSSLQPKKSSIAFDEESKRKYIEKQRKILKRNIKKAHNLFLEFSIAFPLIIVFTILLTIYNSNDNMNHYFQNDNGNWYYKCDFETPDIIYDSIELLFLILIIIKGKTILSYECIFKCTKYISYSSIIGIVLGPLVNVKFYHS